MGESGLESAFPVAVRVDLDQEDEASIEVARAAIASIRSRLPNTPLLISCQAEAIRQALEGIDGVFAAVETPAPDADLVVPGTPAISQDLLELDRNNARNAKLVGPTTDTDPVLQPVPEPDSATLQLQRGWYRTADQVALLLQRRLIFGSGRLGLTEMVYVLIFLAVAGFEAYAHYPTVIPWGVWLYPFGIATAFFIVYVLNVRGLEEAYVSQRTLAEGLRVRFFLRILGTGYEDQGRVTTLHGHHMGWAQIALRGIDLYLASQKAPSVPDGLRIERAAFAQKHWINAQSSYFEGKNGDVGALEKMERSARRSEMISRGALVLSALLVFGWAIFTLNVDHETVEAWEKRATFSTALIIVVSAVVHSYAHKRGYESLAHRYQSIGGFFHHASQEMDRLTARVAQDPSAWDDLQRFAHSVGDMELLESGDWMLVQRERPVEVRAG